MDKAQAQILFLVLIAIAFIGQAIHDFIKKNRANSRRTVPHAARRHNAPGSISNAQVSSAHSATSPRSMTDSHPDTDTSVEIREPDMPDNADAIKHTDTVRHSAPDCDELRKAVIWSEILKRKF